MSELLSPTEEELVRGNRVLRCLELGFHVDDAEQLAASKADLHDVEKQLERGCSHALALRIFRDDG